MCEALTRRQFAAGIAATPLAAPAGSEPVPQLDAVATVRHFADVIRHQYHDATLAVRIADTLLVRLGAGAFAAGNAVALARLMNREVVAISRDAHFFVMAGVGEMRPVPPTEPHQPTKPFSPKEIVTLERASYGFASAEVLTGNVGRIDLRPQFFRPGPEVRQAAVRAMSAVAGTSALIIDLTRNMGGDPNSVAFLLSYFFDRPDFVVNRFHWRNLPTEEFRTTREPGGPKYGEKRPVAVLVGRSTFSAAEEFAYDMQVLKRATIVGQKTAGAANHALPVTVEGGFTAFIPMARAENPITGTNWEGLGITPDVPADPPVTDAAIAVLRQRAA